jgi:hypothetical protein
MVFELFRKDNDKVPQLDMFGEKWTGALATARKGLAEGDRMAHESRRSLDQESSERCSDAIRRHAGQSRPTGFDPPPEPQAHSFNRRIFQSLEVVEATMIHQFDQRVHGFRHAFVIANPADAFIHHTLDTDKNTAGTCKSNGTTSGLW